MGHLTWFTSVGIRALHFIRSIIRDNFTVEATATAFIPLIWYLIKGMHNQIKKILIRWRMKLTASIYNMIFSDLNLIDFFP